MSDLTLAVCRQEGLDVRFHHLDTPRFSLTGEDVADSDEHALALTHGYAKDPRPAVNQAVLALRVWPDGGGPWMSQSWAGHPSATQMFQARAAALIATGQRSPPPRSVGAASQLSPADPATNLQALGFITHLPQTLQLVAPVLTPALSGDMGPRLDDTTRAHQVE